MDYVFPPRPKTAIPPTHLPRYEKTGKWVIQRKFKGTRCLIHVTADRKVIFWNRHHEQHKQWCPTQDIIDQFLALDLQSGLEYWLDGELLHSKVAAATAPHLKNRIVLFDVLMAGQYLMGNPSQLERLSMLNKYCRFPQILEPNHQVALQVSENIWLAQTFDHDFLYHFQEMVHLPEIEGVVLRKRDSVLDSLGTKEYETSWQIRCRKPEGHYCF